jgi:hypothetical protein
MDPVIIDALIKQGEGIASAMEAEVERMNAAGGISAAQHIKLQVEMALTLAKLKRLAEANPEVAARTAPFVERALAATNRIKIKDSVSE